MLLVGVCATLKRLAKTSDAPTCRNYVTHGRDDLTTKESYFQHSSSNGQIDLKGRQVLVAQPGLSTWAMGSETV